MYFVAMALTLRHARCDAPLSAADGPHAHAAVMRAIGDIDPDASRTLHDMRVRKPITIAIVGGDACGAILRLTFMARDGLTYANILADALAARPSLRLGDVACAVESVDLTPYVVRRGHLGGHPVGRSCSAHAPHLRHSDGSDETWRRRKPLHIAVS